MKLIRSIAMLLALLLCWGQLSYALNGGEVMAGASTEVALMTSMDCGEGCGQVVASCQDMACSAEQLCSGGSVFVVPILAVSLQRGAVNVSPTRPDHYHYCSIASIEHPPRASA